LESIVDSLDQGSIELKLQLYNLGQDVTISNPRLKASFLDASPDRKVYFILG
jgi:hypothetical protein